MTQAQYIEYLAAFKQVHDALESIKASQISMNDYAQSMITLNRCLIDAFSSDDADPEMVQVMIETSESCLDASIAILGECEKFFARSLNSAKLSREALDRAVAVST